MDSFADISGCDSNSRKPTLNWCPSCLRLFAHLSIHYAQCMVSFHNEDNIHAPNQTVTIHPPPVKPFYDPLSFNEGDNNHLSAI
jgi:hypothetical protein